MESSSPLGVAATIPSELNWPPPRRVRSSPAGLRWAYLATGVVTLALAATSWVAMMGVHLFQNRAALRSEGIEATGLVTGFSYAGKRNGILVVQYSFAIYGISFTGKADVPKQLEQGVQKSTTIPICYLPAKPEVNHPIAWEESPEYWVCFLFISPMMITVYFGIMMLLSDHKERRLLAEGLPAIATITESHLYGSSRAQRYWRYEFRTRDGDIHTGIIPFDDSQQVGESFCVIYLPQNPRRNLPYPLFDYCIDQ
ncbi:MAG: hypothetical protein WBQ94_25530 [Terracidiphilus sp.]